VTTGPWNARRESPVMRSLVLALAGSPTRLILTTWGMVVLGYTLAPLQYGEGLRSLTVLFVSGCVLSVAAGALLVEIAYAAGPPRPAAGARLGSIEVDGPLRLFAALGIAGAALVAVDKIVIGGLDVSEGLGALRIALQSEEEIFKHRSPALWVGSLLYSFGDVALVLYMFEGEQTRRSTGALVLLSALAPIVVILLYGGRSSAFILFLLAGSACLVRLASGQRALPRARYLRTFLLFYTVVAFVGSVYIFAVRSSVSLEGRGTSVDTLQRWTAEANITIAPAVEAIIDRRDGVSDSLASLMLAVIYAYHPLPELDYLLHENTGAGPFLGEYQGWLVGKAVRLATGMPDITDKLELALHRPGLFYTGWGAMVLDFGLWGALGVLLALGMVGGVLYVVGVKQGSRTARLLLAYSYVVILLSPIHSGFAMGNSLQILFCSLAAWLVLRRRGEASRMLPEAAGGH